MFENFSHTVIFAHRGASSLAPENTLASFGLAVQDQADAIELDAKLSSDGHVVVIHDQTIDRTTDGKGKVNELTLADLKTLDAGSKFATKYTGEKIPTLDEVFEHVGRKLLVNVELTNYQTPKDDLVQKVAEIVRRHDLARRVLFSSFLPKNLIMIKQIIPSSTVALLCLPGITGAFSRSIFMKRVSPHIIHPYLSDVNSYFIKTEHSRGRRVHVWTVNKDSDLKKMAALGVDGVFTDDPGKSRQFFDDK